MLQYKAVYPGTLELLKEDIIPMKLSAISSRGSKKDFFDLFYLLEQYSLKQMICLFNKKFKTDNTFHLFKSLTYFEDADEEPNPIQIEKKKWSEVKIVIANEANNFLRDNSI